MTDSGKERKKYAENCAAENGLNFVYESVLSVVVSYWEILLV